MCFQAHGTTHSVLSQHSHLLINYCRSSQSFYPLPPLPLVSAAGYVFLHLLSEWQMVGRLCKVAMVTSLDPRLRWAILSAGTYSTPQPHLVCTCVYCCITINRWECLVMLRTEAFDKVPGGYSYYFWVGLCRLVLKTLTLFQTKIYDFPHYFRPDSQNVYPISDPWCVANSTGFTVLCGVTNATITSTVTHVTLKMVSQTK